MKTKFVRPGEGRVVYREDGTGTIPRGGRSRAAHHLLPPPARRRGPRSRVAPACQARRQGGPTGREVNASDSDSTQSRPTPGCRSPTSNSTPPTPSRAQAYSPTRALLIGQKIRCRQRGRRAPPSRSRARVTRRHVLRSRLAPAPDGAGLVPNQLDPRRCTPLRSQRPAARPHRRRRSPSRAPPPPAGTLVVYIGDRRIVGAGRERLRPPTQIAALVGAAAGSAHRRGLHRGRGRGRRDADRRRRRRVGRGRSRSQHSLGAGEALPAGVMLAIASRRRHGAGEPDLADLWAVVGDEQYNVIATPWTSGAALTSIETELASAVGTGAARRRHGFRGGPRHHWRR